MVIESRQVLLHRQLRHLNRTHSNDQSYERDLVSAYWEKVKYLRYHKKARHPIQLLAEDFVQRIHTIQN